MIMIYIIYSNIIFFRKKKTLKKFKKYIQINIDLIY